jgi:hypothetical protein
MEIAVELSRVYRAVGKRGPTACGEVENQFSECGMYVSSLTQKISTRKSQMSSSLSVQNDPCSPAIVPNMLMNSSFGAYARMRPNMRLPIIIKPPYTALALVSH